MLYSYHQVKWYQQDNRFILSGYLRDQTTEECVWNFSRVSNQLVNIWTHALAFVYVVYEMINEVFHEIPLLGGDSFDKLAFALFDFVLLLCMLSSVIHHSFNSHRCERVAVKCFSVDWSSCCFVACLCYQINTFCLFRQNPYWLSFYMTGFIILNFTLLYYNLNYVCMGDLKKRMKVSVLVITLSTLPIGHCLYFADTVLTQNIKYWYANNFFWQLFSFLVYLAHFPERYWPERFDLCGQSHNLWHVACVYAILQWKYSALEFLSYVYKYS